MLGCILIVFFYLRKGIEINFGYLFKRENEFNLFYLVNKEKTYNSSCITAVFCKQKFLTLQGVTKPEYRLLVIR